MKITARYITFTSQHFKFERIQEHNFGKYINM